MNFGDLIAKGSAVFLKKKLSAMQAVFDAGTAPEKAAFQASVSGGIGLGNLIVNGGFDSPANWTLDAGFTISGGVLTSSVSNSKAAVSTLSLVSGGIYLLSWNQTAVTVNATKILIKTPADVFVCEYVNTVGPSSVVFRAPVSGLFALWNYQSGVVYDNLCLLRLA